MPDNDCTGVIALTLATGVLERPKRSQAEVAGMTDLMEGDVVQLKSGGPKMTVDALHRQAGQSQAKCTWFDGAVRMSDLFELHSLRNLEDGVPKGITVSRMLDLDS